MNDATQTDTTATLSDVSPAFAAGATGETSYPPQTSPPPPRSADGAARTPAARAEGPHPARRGPHPATFDQRLTSQDD
jgi:hypothetical protein